MTYYKPGDLVYLTAPQSFLLRTRSSKFTVIYIGPLIVYKIKDTFQSIFMDIEGKI